jgi:hypothetical protein
MLINPWPLSIVQPFGFFSITLGRVPTATFLFMMFVVSIPVACFHLICVFKGLYLSSLGRCQAPCFSGLFAA